MFLCANDKQVITQKLSAIMKIFYARFSYLAVIPQVENYKTNSRKYLPYCTRHCAVTQYLYINKIISMEKQSQKNK